MLEKIEDHVVRKWFVHCDNCGSHVGRGFQTGADRHGDMKYFANSCALKFKPAPIPDYMDTAIVVRGTNSDDEDATANVDVIP